MKNGFYKEMAYPFIVLVVIALVAAALLGVTFARQFVLWTEGITLNIFGFAMQNKQFILLVTGILVMAGGVVMWILQRQIEGKQPQE